MKTHIYKTRVRYCDIDGMKVVYYANYLKYFEAARTELLREEGYTYKRLEDEGFLLPVSESHINYKKPAYYDDELTVYVTFGFIKNASCKIKYTVKNQNDDIVCTGHTIHPVVSTNWEIIRIPDQIRPIIEKYLE